MPSRTHPTDDPLALVMAPPPDETPEAQAARLARELEARQISEKIDEQLRQERANLKKGKVVKLLLLGQSESGKSTTLRQFQRLYTPSAFREERILWRSVIQLNLVRSVRKILDALSEHLSTSSSSTTPNDAFSLRLTLNGGGGSGDDSDSGADDSATYFSRSERERERDPEAELQELCMRLMPLRHIEQLLIAKLVPPDEEEATRFAAPASAYMGSVNGEASGSGSGYASGNGYGYGMSNELREREWEREQERERGREGRARKEEIFVRPGTAWKGFVARGKGRPASPTHSHSPSNSISYSNGHEHPHSHPHSHSHSHSISNGYVNANMIPPVPPLPHEYSSYAHTNGHAHGHAHAPSLSVSVSTTSELSDEPTAVLHACATDISTLWRSPHVRSILSRRKIRLDEQPGFFLDDIQRIAGARYLPSDDDVLRARLKTVGVSEHRFEMESGRESGTEWRIVDVGGSRSQRPTWIPFFEDVNAIIFLAPISGFDQVLAEDRSVNRLEDSVLLWKMICSNKLLANVELVLFLNKCDILDRKLKKGVRLVKYVRSFQERSNDSETVQKYFRAKFAAIQREYSPNPRKFYGFCTSVTEVVTTSGILASVRDIVIREHLKRSKLL